MSLPDDYKARIAGVTNDDKIKEEENANNITGVNRSTENEEEDNRRRSHRVRLKNPRYYNDGMINATISKEDIPELQLQECNQPKMMLDEDVVMCVFEYVLTQYELMKRLTKHGSKGEEATEKS